MAQYDLEGNLLNVFYTAQEALEFLGISNKRSGNIGRCIKGERKTAYGYIWKQY
ncbi:NUMOD1 domain-containing DNA-binding protein [Klebsiella pneumoniae]|uniref:NUMOD1 domain-containing DNA-binding protein n=1 Tax=Klebsiella pneumoniae TaxID=573 RepID=UPI003970E92E